MGTWSAATEREVREFEDGLTMQLEQIERLHRQREREVTALLDREALPALEVVSFEDYATVPCATCARDYRARIGPELQIVGAPGQVVCWPCGMEIDPQRTAEVLAQRADYAEQEALHLLAMSAKWFSDHVASLGSSDRADYFEERSETLREHLRRLKTDGYTDAASWL